VIDDEDVDWSEDRLDIIDQPLGSSRINHVHAESPGRSATGDNLGRECLGQLRVAAVANCDSRILDGQSPADRCSDTAARPRDQREPPRHVEFVSHRSSTLPPGRGPLLERLTGA
jgi:hypothetical protein